MALVPPATLSPSKVSSFSDCALAFRYSAVDLLPEPPSPAATKGSLVHLALEHLFEREPAARTPEAAEADLARAIAEMRTDPDFTGLELSAEEEAAFFADAATLVGRYFELEDPTTIRPIGLELRLEANVGGLRLRGIIDRLELDADGGLVVTDYKTGRSPGVNHTQGRLGGVTFYALLCQELFGVRPKAVQLLYLADATAITGTFPVDQRVALGDRIYGCDDCQEVCPPNRVEVRRAAPGGRGEPVPFGDPDRAWVPVLALLAASDDELMAAHGRWYVPERQPRYLRRNALVVLGNVGDGRDPAVRAALAGALADPDPLLRAHAVWSARRLGCDDLLVTVAHDPDPDVQAELVGPAPAAPTAAPAARS